MDGAAFIVLMLDRHRFVNVYLVYVNTVFTHFLSATCRCCPRKGSTFIQSLRMRVGRHLDTWISHWDQRRNHEASKQTECKSWPWLCNFIRVRWFARFVNIIPLFFQRKSLRARIFYAKCIIGLIIIKTGCIAEKNLSVVIMLISWIPCLFKSEPLISN